MHVDKVRAWPALDLRLRLSRATMRATGVACRLIFRPSPFMRGGINQDRAMIGHNLKNTRAETWAPPAVCSFDVFDTFLLRACTTSEGVFERAFQLSPVSRTHPDAVVSYLQHRIQAEARARRTKLDKSDTVEVKIAEIYAYFPFRLFGLERTDLPKLVQAEFQAELDLCRTNVEILRLYQDARKFGQRTGFISDTYWDAGQLSTLLRTCQPDLEWDFLYASCESATNKSNKLFERYLSEQGVDPSTALHIGDNENADIKGARRHGIRTRHYPQASGAFAVQLQRESAAFALLCSRSISRLDHGLRTLRRVVVARAPEKTPSFHLGVTTLGPVMCAFDSFVAHRAARLRGNGEKVAVAFLGRDGFLSFRIWREMRGDTASYIEVNRRVSLIGSATTIDPIVDLFRKVTRIDAKTFADVLKLEVASVAAFFGKFPDGIATGKELADALPRLVEEDQIRDLASNMRREIVAHLRASIPDFDQCTDVVLADLGYSGSVQKALRRVLDCEGIKTRLHGAYLLTMDDSFDDLADGDTAEGFVSDLVVTPHVKRMLMRNVAVLEQLCCSSVGSVQCYENGAVQREINTRPPEQIKLGEEAQAGTLAFAGGVGDVAGRYRLEPFSDLDVASGWATAILGRLLLLPTDDELALLGSLKHDVNLGTVALAPMLDPGLIKRLQIVAGLPAACTAPAPPMWLAGSFSGLSPAHGFLYMLFGANKLPPDVFADIKCGFVKIGIFLADGKAGLETVPRYRSGLGDLRVRIAISSQMQVRSIVIPMAQIASEGLIQGIVVRTGKTVERASSSPDAFDWPEGKLISAGLERSGRYYRATNDDGCLIVNVDALSEPIAIFSVAVTSLSNDRVWTPHDVAAEGRSTLELLHAAVPAIPL